MRLLLVKVFALLSALGDAGSAEGACLPGDITGMTVGSTSLAPYNPFATFAPKLVTITVTATRSCGVELAFSAPAGPPRMTGAGMLNYDVQAPVSGTSLVYVGAVPSTSVHIDIGSGNVGSTTVQINVPTAQIVADGLYSDASVVASVFDKSGSVLTVLKSVSFPVNGTVMRACQFGNLSSPTLDFSSSIANGLPGVGITHSVTFDNINCTAPSLLRLSGGPMNLTQASQPTTVFDSSIHYRAAASFLGAVTTLDTSSASEAVSMARNTSIGATSNGTVRVDVTLIRGKPLLQGTYTSILTLSIDPSP